MCAWSSPPSHRPHAPQAAHARTPDMRRQLKRTGTGTPWTWNFIKRAGTLWLVRATSWLACSRDRPPTPPGGPSVSSADAVLLSSERRLQRDCARFSPVGLRHRFEPREASPLPLPIPRFFSPPPFALLLFRALAQAGTHCPCYAKYGIVGSIYSPGIQLAFREAVQ